MRLKSEARGAKAFRAVATLVLMLAGTCAYAQNRIGGHFGVALPLIAHGQGETTTISDDFVIVFPTGITVRKSDVFAFDLELAPVVQNDPRHIDLTVHPGVAWGIGNGYSVGGRVAFDIGKESWGFTPLFNKGLLQVGKDSTLFAELDVPVRFKQDAHGVGYTSVGLAVVVGIGF
jgi:hypothetical protein